MFAPQLGWPAMGLSYASTQLQQRLLPLVSGARGLETRIDVGVERPQGDAVMFCEPPKPRLSPLRTAGTLGLQFVGSLAAL